MKNEMGTPIKILFLAAEAVPFIKIGGLGDVAGTLPKAIHQLSLRSPELVDIDIRLMIPFHKAIDRTSFHFEHVMDLNVDSREGSFPARVYRTETHGIPVFLLDGPLISKEEAVYSQDAALDGQKYTFFSLAALQVCQEHNWRPDILHANDWHTSPAIYGVGFDKHRFPVFQYATTLLEVHNLPYLGVGAGEALSAFGLPPTQNEILPAWARSLPLPLGLLVADHIVTVSPGYAKEILTPEFGSGLHEFLKTRSQSISGILNGLDTVHWDPMTDEVIPVNFGLSSLNTRADNKLDLLRACGLSPEPNVPLLGMITRLDYQKGVDLALNALRHLWEVPWQFVLIGTGDATLEQDVRHMEAEFPNRVRGMIRYDESVSRQIYAGADMLIIPSRYEPCGLTQMIAMRYGCIPIGRATGGLQDTILDYDHNRAGTGFLFKESEPEELARSLTRAIEVYQDQRRWRGLQRRGMRQDFSWERSALAYHQLYLSLVRLRRRL